MRPPYNHCEVKEKSTQRAHQENHHIRDIRDTYKARLSRYFANIGWQCVTNQPIYEEKLQVNLYSNLVEIGISSILSERSNKAYPKDAPWISVVEGAKYACTSTPFIQTNTVVGKPQDQT